MSEDRELLELAAKAVGIHLWWAGDNSSIPVTGLGEPWEPLTDDGDALRLAVKLRLDIDHHKDSVNVWESYFGTGFIPNGDDPCAATRLAIVRAAAALGKARP